MGGDPGGWSLGVGGGKSAFHEVIESLAVLENRRWKFGECKQPLERTDFGQLNSKPGTPDSSRLS